jgi:hypothetical protein
MSRFWRRIAPVIVAGGLVAGTGAIPAEAASPAAYSVTIGAKVAYPTVTHDKLVIYQIKGFDTAAIHGEVSGAKPGDLVTLLAKPFGATSYAATTDTIKMTAGSLKYSFTVQPSRATAYRIRISTGGHIDLTSAVQTVYVAIQAVPVGKPVEKCTTTHCTYSIKTDTRLPSRDYKQEAGKHVYMYVSVGAPPPSDYTLSTRSTVSKARKLNAGEFQLSFTFYVPITTPKDGFFVDACTKDSESHDGLGLPGHHGCGARNVNRKVADLYLG